MSTEKTRNEDLPLGKEFISELRKEMGLDSLAYASIRNIVQFINRIEEITNIRFIRTEMGVPGLPPPEEGIRAEIEALRSGMISKYPPIEGIPELKKEISRFARLFLDIEADPEGCLATVGSMQGAMAAFMVSNRCIAGKETTLFIDPGFPVNKKQLSVLGLPCKSFDIYNYRGNKLRDKLLSYLEENTIATFIYSNPNNPSWICLTDNELKIIGELATCYGIIVIEDLAYFGMDFRQEYGLPGIPPYQPTVAKYTDNYIILISSSKAFSYAGQRIAAMIISGQLYTREYPELKRYFSNVKFGPALIQDVIYTLSAGAAYSAQAGLSAIFSAVNNGTYNFVEHIREYADRAGQMKKHFTDCGFNIVYDRDEDKLLADGFYFTVSYPGFSGEQLLAELIRYGISAITLDTTGSDRKEGLRICVSQTPLSDMPVLAKRLALFNTHHK